MKYFSYVSAFKLETSCKTITWCHQCGTFRVQNHWNYYVIINNIIKCNKNIYFFITHLNFFSDVLFPCSEEPNQTNFRFCWLIQDFSEKLRENKWKYFCSHFWLNFFSHKKICSKISMKAFLILLIFLKSYISSSEVGMNISNILESNLPNFYLWLQTTFSIFATKLYHFTVNHIFHVLQTLKLNMSHKTKFVTVHFTI